jgi:hypothetical protein
MIVAKWIFLLALPLFLFNAGRVYSALVVLNRSTKSYRVRKAWPGEKFSHRELTDPYQPNAIKPAPENDYLLIEPGAIITLTSVPLRTYRP